MQLYLTLYFKLSHILYLSDLEEVSTFVSCLLILPLIFSFAKFFPNLSQGPRYLHEQHVCLAERLSVHFCTHLTEQPHSQREQRTMKLQRCITRRFGAIFSVRHDVIRKNRPENKPWIVRSSSLYQCCTTLSIYICRICQRHEKNKQDRWEAVFLPWSLFQWG